MPEKQLLEGYLLLTSTPPEDRLIVQAVGGLARSNQARFNNLISKPGEYILRQQTPRDRLMALHAAEFVVADVSKMEGDGLFELGQAIGADKPTLTFTYSSPKTEHLQDIDKFLSERGVMVQHFSHYPELNKAFKNLTQEVRDKSMPIPPIVYKDLEIDLEAKVVRKNHKLVNLSPREYQLLVYLAKRPGVLVSNKTAVPEIWGTDTSESNFSTVLHRLRAKISYDGQQYIFPSNGRGVVFGK